MLDFDVFRYDIIISRLSSKLGSHPYPGMGFKDVVDAVHKGERLPQPKHCGDEM